jgi:hypothetical protein
MKPPDGLILQLRNTARILMSALYYAQKWQNEPKRDLAEILPGGARRSARQGFTAWPVDVNQMLGYKRMSLPDDMPSIDGKDSQVMPELKPICNILRRQAEYTIETGYDDIRPFDEKANRIGNKPQLVQYESRNYDEYDEADLAALKDALNLPASSVWQGPVDHASYRPCYLLVNGPPLRILADMLMDFTFMLVSDYGITGKRPVYGLHEHNPIAVCQHCDGLFIRTRSDGEYCSVKCRSAAWSQSKGKEYFAEKQRESRAARKNQREAKRNRKK